MKFTSSCNLLLFVTRNALLISFCVFEYFNFVILKILATNLFLQNNLASV